MKMWASRISFKRKLILSFFLFYMLPLILVFWIGYGIIFGLLSSQGEEYYKRIFDTTVDRIDTSFDSMQSFNITMQNRYWLKHMIYMESLDKFRFDRVDLRYFAEELRGFTLQGIDVNQAFYYFPVSDTFLSTTDSGIIDFDWFVNVSFKNTYMQQENYRELAAGLKKPDYMVLDVDNYGRKVGGILCSYPVKEWRGESLCNLYFFIRTEELNKLLDLALPRESNWFYMIHNERVIINRTPLSDEELLKMEADSSEAQDGMKDFRLQSDRTGLYYCNWVPQEYVYEHAQRMQFILLVTAIVFSLIGFFFSYYAAIRNYRPVQELMSFIKDKVPHEEANKNEFYWLQGAVEALVDTRKNLDIQIAEQKPILKNAFLTWLLKENFKPSEEKILHTAKLIGIEFGMPYFNCLLCSLKAGINLEKEIQMLLEDHKLHYEIIVYQKDYVVILNYDRKETVNLFYERLSDLLYQEEEAYFFGVGKGYESIEMLPAAYTEAKEARNFRMVNRKCGITYFDEINRENTYFYPVEKESALSNHLLSGEYENSLIVFNELVKENLKSEKVSFGQMKNFFDNVKLTCLRCIKRLDAEQFINVDLLEEECGVIEDYLNTYYNIFRQICDYIAGHKESSSEVIKESMKRFIEENICRKELSLSYVAEAFSLSPSYVSRLFKEKSGTTFLEYVNRERIERAKMLLLSDNQINIQEIGNRVGYDNDMTFRRIFKKYEGITPSQFREIR